MDFSFYEQVSDRFKFLDGLYHSKKQQCEQAQTQVQALIAESDVLQKTEKVLKHLIDKLAREDLSKMDKLVTYGLKTVFPDRNIEFRSSLEERGKKIYVNLQTIYDDNVIDPDSRSSINVIESFLLRILCLIKLKKARFLMLDETFAAVDSGYIDNVSQLISEMASKLGMDILLVTHNPAVAEYVNHSYRLVHRNNLVEIEKIK